MAKITKKVKFYMVVALTSAVMTMVSGLFEFSFSHMLGWLIAMLEALTIINMLNAKDKGDR